MFMESRKMDLFAGQDGDTDTESRFTDTGGGRGWGRLREQHWNMYSTVCKTDSRCGFAGDVRGSDSGLGDKLEGWGGRWEGGVRGRGHMYTYEWFMLMFGRNQHSIVKQLLSNHN